jgi:hypothetical protein
MRHYKRRTRTKIEDGRLKRREQGGERNGRAREAASSRELSIDLSAQERDLIRPFMFSITHLTCYCNFRRISNFLVHGANREKLGKTSYT